MGKHDVRVDKRKQMKNWQEQGGGGELGGSKYDGVSAL